MNEAKDPQAASGPASSESCRDDAPVLVVVVVEPADLARARHERWYRVPVARAPRRIAAEFLAFYQTGAFSDDERWAIHWFAPVYGYQIATRSELIPAEPNHPRAGELYFRINLGPLQALPRPVPSRRLRRITFIATTLGRLLAAKEINDLWVKSKAQERLWEALKELRIEAERQLPLDEDFPHQVADFGVPGRRPVALIVTDEPPEEADGRVMAEAPAPDYVWALHPWQILGATRAELEADLMGWAHKLGSGDEEDTGPAN